MTPDADSAFRKGLLLISGDACKTWTRIAYVSDAEFESCPACPFLVAVSPPLRYMRTSHCFKRMRVYECWRCGNASSAHRTAETVMPTSGTGGLLQLVRLLQMDYLSPLQTSILRQTIGCEYAWQTSQPEGPYLTQMSASLRHSIFRGRSWDAPLNHLDIDGAISSLVCYMRARDASLLSPSGAGTMSSPSYAKDCLDDRVPGFSRVEYFTSSVARSTVRRRVSPSSSTHESIMRDGPTPK